MTKPQTNPSSEWTLCGPRKLKRLKSYCFTYATRSLLGPFCYPVQLTKYPETRGKIEIKIYPPHGHVSKLRRVSL